MTRATKRCLPERLSDTIAASALLLCLFAYPAAAQQQAGQGSNKQATTSSKIQKPRPQQRKDLLVVPTITLMPFGIDQIGLVDTSGRKGYFGVQPMVVLVKNFRTAFGQPINLQAGYRLTWKEFPRQDLVARTFDHVVFGKLNVPWTEKLSTALETSMFYSAKAGSPIPMHNLFLVNAEASMWRKVNRQFRFKAGYWMRFLEFIDWSFPVETAPQLSPFFEFLPLDSFGSFSSLPSQPVPENVHLVQHAVATGMEYKPWTKTTFELDYRLVFYHASNFAAMDTGDHYIEAAITQKLPWKGASIKVENDVWFHSHDKTAVGGTSDDLDIHNWFTFTFNQGINKYISAELYFRHLAKTTKIDIFHSLDQNSSFYVGTKLTF